MRILHVTSGNMYGGIETLLLNLAGYGQRADLQQQFAMSFAGRVFKELKAENFSAHLLGEVRFSRPFSLLKARQQFSGLLAEGDFNAALFHGPWAYAAFASVAKARGLPTIFWAHGLHTGEHWLERLAKLTIPDFAIAVSNSAADCMRSNMFSGIRVETIYPPVAPSSTSGNSEKRASIRRELGASTNSVVILQAGRMECGKGHELHLNALAGLKQNDSWTCWIAGGAQTETERRYVERLIKLASRLLKNYS